MKKQKKKSSTADNADNAAAIPERGLQAASTSLCKATLKRRKRRAPTQLAAAGAPSTRSASRSDRAPRPASGSARASRAVSRASRETPRRATAPVPVSGGSDRAPRPHRSADSHVRESHKTKPADKLSALQPGAPDILIKTSPLNILLPYQRTLADDSTRFKYALQARQTGKDFTSGAEGIRDCLLHEKNKDKVNWLIAAPSERQSIESLEKWKEWTDAFKLEIAQSITERTDPRNSESLVKSATIIFPHGSRVMAVPGKPDTVRGFSANILLTEFAFFEDPDATWRAILPSITNPLRGGLKKCRLVTTPNGVGNKAHELWVKNYQVPGSKWSCHHVDIHEAIAQGLPVELDELKAALDDPEGWAQEYELNFLDQATVLLPYELIVPCENPLATATCDPEFWNTNVNGGPPLFCGIDFGRNRDLTICWSAELIGNALLMTKEVLELSQMSTPAQMELLRPRLRRATRVCLDYTGPGIGLGDLMVDPREGFGEYKPAAHQYGKVELCHFTNQLKLEIFPALRVAFEQKSLAVPCVRVIREDLHSVSRVLLAGGGITYRAPHTKDGHADRCTALALCRRASATAATSTCPGFIFENTRQSIVNARRADRSLEG